MPTEFTVKEFSKETWTDFETLFGKHKGVRGGCWCTFNLCTSTQFDKMTKDERREFQRELAFQGRSSGLLVYENGIPVAWCQFGLADRFGRFERMRTYNELYVSAGSQQQWRISCLFVDKHRRREGLSKFALRSALEFIRKKGGGVVDAFPMVVPNSTHPQYTGSEKMYRNEGFEKIATLGKNTILMRLTIQV